MITDTPISDGSGSGGGGGGATQAVGDVVFSPAAPATGTWLECKGQVLSQASYAALYAAVGLIGFAPYTAWSVNTAASGTKQDAVYADGKFVITTSSSSLLVSTDEGATYTNNSAIALLGVAYSPTLALWAGAHSSGSIYTATNPASTWTERSADLTNAQRAICWDSTNSVFVSVGAGGTIYTSPDGTTWTQRTSGTSVQLNGVAAGGGIVVAVGASGTILTASNPTGTWTSRTSGVSATLGSTGGGGGARYGGGYFVVGSTAVGLLLTSSDGITWSKILPPVELRGVPLSKIAFGNNRFFVAPTSIAVSFLGVFNGDGTDWQVIPIPEYTAVGALAVSPTSLMLAVNASTHLVAPVAASYQYNSGTHFMLPDFPTLPAPVKAWIKAA